MLSLFKPLARTNAVTSAENGSQPPPTASQLPVTSPVVDVIDTGAEVVLYAELPGVEASGLDVTIDGDRLTLRGCPGSQIPQGLTALHREYDQRVFERSFAISDTIDRHRISARIANGVATLTLPRHQTVAPRKVEITSA